MSAAVRNRCDSAMRPISDDISSIATSSRASRFSTSTEGGSRLALEPTGTDVVEVGEGVASDRRVPVVLVFIQNVPARVEFAKFTAVNFRRTERPRPCSLKPGHRCDRVAPAIASVRAASSRESSRGGSSTVWPCRAKARRSHQSEISGFFGSSGPCR